MGKSRLTKTKGKPKDRKKDRWGALSSPVATMFLCGPVKFNKNHLVRKSRANTRGKWDLTT